MDNHIFPSYQIELSVLTQDFKRLIEDFAFLMMRTIQVNSEI